MDVFNYLIEDLNGEEIVGTFYKNGKVMIILFRAGLIKKLSLYK